MNSYGNALIKFVATHYLDIHYGKITPDEMQDFTKSAGRKNPLETALIWKADFDVAFIALSSTKYGWKDALRDRLSDEMIVHLARSNEVSNWQRDIINQCILKDCLKTCKDTGYGKSKLCWNEHIITRMRKFLNGEGRDESGRFTAKLAAVTGVTVSS